MNKYDFTNKENLRSLIKNFNYKTHFIESFLNSSPLEWGRYQNTFNVEVNYVFRKLMDFEMRCLSSNEKEKVLKLKRFFMKKLKKPFERGDYIRWVVKKPYGYAGDFKYIEDIYLNSPQTLGFERLFDNYTMMSAIAIAVRNRKDDFKRIIKEFVLSNNERNLRIMNIGSGPAREIYELLKEDLPLFRNTVFDCYDNDEKSINFSKNRLHDFRNVNFFNKNVVRFVFKKEREILGNLKYDMIYSTGLFDYFDDNITLRLLQSLRQFLNLNGMLVISDVRDRYSNPSLYFMEWVGEWDLVYRNDDEFRSLFINAGFMEGNIYPLYEQQGILQYIKAINA